MFIKNKSTFEVVYKDRPYDGKKFASIPVWWQTDESNDPRYLKPGARLPKRFRKI